MEGTLANGQSEDPDPYAYDDEDDDDQLTFSKEFVFKFFEFKTFTEATDWIHNWYNKMKHNTTEFTSEFPALVDQATDYRKEKLAKLKTAQQSPDQNNPEQMLQDFPREQLMSQCIIDYGMF